MTLLVYYTTYVLNDPAAAAKSLSWNAIVGLIELPDHPLADKRDCPRRPFTSAA